METTIDAKSTITLFDRANSKLQNTMNKSLQATLIERGMEALVHRWRKCIANGVEYVEK
jgi:hypothetical protein